MRRVSRWPLVVLGAPAGVAIWGGWVGLGEMTGFGEMNLLPGVAEDGDWATINTAITLPIGMEAYAAYALHAWLSSHHVPAAARRFAKWSAIGALALGASGQIAYHLLAAAEVTSAPWWVTMLVACFPVGVLGMGAALAHLLNDDSAEPAQVVAAEPAQGELVEPVPEPGQVGVPEPSEPAHELPAEPAQTGQPDPAQTVAEPVQKRRREPAQQQLNGSTADRVKAAHDQEPQAAHQRIAELARVSVATVKRHRPPARVNGHDWLAEGEARHDD